MKSLHIETKDYEYAILSGGTLELYYDKQQYRDAVNGVPVHLGAEIIHRTKNDPLYYIPSNNYSNNQVRNARRRRQKIKRIIRENWINDYSRRPKFITLTCEDNCNIETGAHRRDMLLKNLRRRYPQGLFIIQAELQARGAYHLHIIAMRTPYLQLSMLTKVWPWGGRKINQIKTIKGVECYVTKYITDYVDRETGEITVDVRTYRARMFSISGVYARPRRLDTALLVALGISGKIVYRGKCGYTVMSINLNNRKRIDSCYQFERLKRIPQSKFVQIPI